MLALYSIDVPRDPSFIFAAMALFAVATAISLLPGGRMPVWVASFDVAVAVVITALVSSQLDLGREGGTGYATWHVAAVGTLMTIVSSRRRHLFAWGGIVFLVVHTIAWAGPSGIASLGVLGSISWVAVSHIISVALANASRDAQRFAIAEREALDWQAAQDAHVYERQFRLGQTMAMALPMLKRIEKTGGELSESERTECLHLEGAIRDEIRGRKLLNDAVREEVMLARRRGATVTLLDEGGLDDLDEFELERVLARLAARDPRDRRRPGDRAHGARGVGCRRHRRGAAHCRRRRVHGARKTRRRGRGGGPVARDPAHAGHTVIGRNGRREEPRRLVTAFARTRVGAITRISP